MVPAYPGSPGKKAVKRLCVCVCVDGSVESVNVVGLSEQPETTTSMDCTQSETLNDFIEIISNEYAGGQVCCLLSRLLLKKFDTWSWTDGYEFVHHMRKMSPYHTCLM